MRCASVNGFKEPDKMEFGETGFPGNVFKVNVFAEMRIDKKPGMHDALVNINAWI